MRSLLGRLIRPWKTKRLPRAPCDCQHWLTAVPEAPSLDQLTHFVHQQHFGHGEHTKGNDATAGADDAEEAAFRSAVVRATVFDLRYNCAGEGRCTCVTSSPHTCAFPRCCAMRPMMKGAEVHMTRQLYEHDSPRILLTPCVDHHDDTSGGGCAEEAEAVRELIEQAASGHLDEAAAGIQRLVAARLSEAAMHKTLRESGRVPREDEKHASASSDDALSRTDGINDAPASEQAHWQHVCALYSWRAALLVNRRRDAEAVHSLLNLAEAAPRARRAGLLATAARWAALNDMEIVYYRALLQQHQSFDRAVHFARVRPLLLSHVLHTAQTMSRPSDAEAGDTGLVELCVRVILETEVEATMSRTRAGQRDKDTTEDPMRSLCMPLMMSYYRLCLGEAFWSRFFSLLCLPPAAPETAVATEQHASTAPGATHSPRGRRRADDGVPWHVLDAVSRSLLLHHLILFAAAREKELESGELADRVRARQRAGQPVRPMDAEGHVLNEKDRAVAVARLRQLLIIARGYETGGAAAAADGVGVCE